MAKYDVTHRCGHTVTVQLVGPHKERARRIEWMRTNHCFSCDNEIAAQAARETASKAGLPALTGSPKQIAWAETLRAKKITEFEAAADVLGKKYIARSKAARAELADALALLHHEVFGEAASRYWIDARDGQSITYETLGETIKARGLAPTLQSELEARAARRRESGARVMADLAACQLGDSNVDLDGDSRPAVIRVSPDVTLTLLGNGVVRVVGHGWDANVLQSSKEFQPILAAAQVIADRRAGVA